MEETSGKVNSPGQVTEVQGHESGAAREESFQIALIIRTPASALRECPIDAEVAQGAAVLHRPSRQETAWLGLSRRSCSRIRDWSSWKDES